MDTEIPSKYIENKIDQNKVHVDYDELLSSAGELGCYQWILFFAIAPFCAFGVFVYFSQVFMTEISPNHWCYIPELENLTIIQRRDIGVPKDVNTRFGYSHCEMYDVNWIDVLETGQNPDKTWKKVPCRHGWEFNESEIPYPTIGSELEWVCEKNSYQATAQSIFFVGSIFGGLLFGWIADRFGRIPAIISSCLVGGAGGFISGFTRNLLEFSAARFVTGMANDNCMHVAYLLFLELIAPKYRTLMANLCFAIFYSLFVTVIPWIALACGHWKIISLVTSLPLGLAVFANFILPESPRWLLSKGRVDEVIENVLTIGRINKNEVPVNMIDQFKFSLANVKDEQNQSWSEIFRRPVVRKMFSLICLEYMSCAIIFDGLVRSIGQLEFDFFISFSVISFTEFPSVIIVAFFMDLTGRRWLCIVFMTFACIFCILTVFASGALTVIYAVMARFCVNVGFSAAIQWAPELLPTPVRASGVAVIHICGYLASFFVPYIVYLKVYIYWLPLTMIACIAGLAVLIACALPETAMKDMPHTFEDAEQLTKNQRFWTLPYLETRKRKRTEKSRTGQINNSFENEA